MNNKCNIMIHLICLDHFLAENKVKEKDQNLEQKYVLH